MIIKPKNEQTGFIKNGKVAYLGHVTPKTEAGEKPVALALALVDADGVMQVNKFWRVNGFTSALKEITAKGWIRFDGCHCDQCGRVFSGEYLDKCPADDCPSNEAPESGADDHPTLYDALIALSREIRKQGYAIAIYTPEELDAMDLNNEEAEEAMIGFLNDAYPRHS